MIYLTDNATSITIPIHSSRRSSVYSLLLSNKGLEDFYLFSDEPCTSHNAFYEVFDVDEEILSKLQKAEYEYRLLDADGEVMEVGLLSYLDKKDDGKQLTVVDKPKLQVQL